MTDVCLLTENTYPHALGGVAEWVDRLVRHLPGVTFSVAALRAHDDLDAPTRYRLPDNVRELAVLGVDPGSGAVDGDVPHAAVYHALCAGAASDAAVAAAARENSAFVLSEHGLAWREALHGITGCRPMRRPEPVSHDPRGEARRWSRRLARDATRAYAAADVVTGLSHHARRWQLRLGADATRSVVLSNPVAPAAPREHHTTQPVFAFVGRVVAIKDVLTFVRACRHVADVLPDARFEVIGPLDAEPGYVARCEALTAALGLEDRLRFTGEQPLDHWRATADVVVLTSRSEGQPLVLLEAMAAGIPVVATAVGGVPELLARGGGALVAPGDARAVAARALDFADPEARRRVGDRGRRVVRLRHDARIHARAHADLYERLRDTRGGRCR
jgi:glycosyltransferase involved in cell wall biosynthesis